MADTDQAPPAPPAEGPAAHAAGESAETPAAPNAGRLRLFLILCAAVALIAAGGGYGTAVLLTPAQPPPENPDAAPAPDAAAPPTTPGPDTSPNMSKDLIYYDFEPIIVNLDEPRLARYVRVSITLAIRVENAEAARKILDKRKPELKNWLTVYFASCTLEEVRGSVNLNRLQREIDDNFCQQLWPDSKPLISHVLFKEFGVS
jgi:flagellar basal body-associated protein FliL